MPEEQGDDPGRGGRVAIGILLALTFGVPLSGMILVVLSPGLSGTGPWPWDMLFTIGAALLALGGFFLWGRAGLARRIHPWLAREDREQAIWQGLILGIATSHRHAPEDLSALPGSLAGWAVHVVVGAAAFAVAFLALPAVFKRLRRP